MAWSTDSWMGEINDDKSLAHISIPGSHDSLATEKSLAYDLTAGFLGELGSLIKLVDKAASTFGVPTIKSALDSAVASQAGNAQTTTQSISSQLQDGVRFFDFRFRLADNQLWGQHGMVPMKISGKSAIKQIDDYLERYPSETVVVNIQPENKGGQNIPVSIKGWGADYKCTAPKFLGVKNYLDPDYLACKIAKESRDTSWGAVRSAASALKNVGNTWKPSPTKETNTMKVINYSNNNKEIKFDINVNDWANNNISFTQAVEKELIDSLPGKKDNWFLEDRIPSLEEARGKVVMINNFDQNKKIGIMTGGSIPQNGNSGDHLWFDNKWNGISKEDKLALNIASMDSINSKKPDRLSIVFTSASAKESGFQPTHYSNFSNPNLPDYFKTKSGQIGTIAGDFFDKKITTGIIETNSRDLDGGTGDDKILGASFNDNIVGGKGDDKLRGKKGSDFLHGGIGSDTLLGGRGDDKLLGGGNKVCDWNDMKCQADVLVGGKGADAFILGKGNIDIKDYSEVDSLLIAKGIASSRNLQSEQQGNDVLLSSPNGLNTIIRDTTLDAVINEVQYI